MHAVYESLKEDLRRFAYSIANHEQEGNDLIQDALEKALLQKDLIDWPRYKQKAWFYRVMKNNLIDQRRKNKRETDYDEAFETALPFGKITSFEMVDILKNLPRNQSDIIFKRYWIGLSSNEIAEKLEIPASTVRYQLAQAIKTLRKYFEEE
ncbi:RNA polymerase sigma-70 factor (ECF subfamily) [Cytobacillus purgationiresistens]|uniref:RNA polymerase sigma-70 factor (ECF subfamily) n=1 Tax=Cytobacillus purgationiresistens TaxID=863449 RepID=A0ABU0ANB9_9BACI|nr:RNA polymerase sigma-70 factor (ECF subfamily) [Cytobacillus purgationiresistens]